MDSPSHWTTLHANEAIEKFGDTQVVCAGWSPSGIYHIGNSREAVTCNGFHKELLRQGKKSKFIFVIDDFDSLDKIPQNLKKYKGELRKYLGHPLNRIPDPFKDCESYAEHFAKDAKKAMKDWGFDVEFVSATDLYKAGRYDKYLKTYIEKEDEVQNLIEEISGSPLDSLISINCQNCGNQKTTNFIKFEKDKLFYLCQSSKQFRGCGHEGFTPISEHEWKLKWRLDWPARQSFLNVTIEPSGKDHSVAGGSVDTSLAIHKNIFGEIPLLLLRYGFITLKGKKFSGSAGGALPASKINEIMPPSAYLFLIYRSDMLKDINFNPQSNEYGSLLDEFDISRRMLKGEKFSGRGREEAKLKTAAELSMTDLEKARNPSLIKFNELALVFQTSLNDIDLTINKLDNMDKFPDESSKEDIRDRLPRVQNWLDELAPETMKFKFLDELPADVQTYWDPNTLHIWRNSIKQITNDMDAQDFNTILRDEASSLGLTPKEFYPPFYKLLIGKERGPNAANLVLAIGKEELLEKLNSINV